MGVKQTMVINLVIAHELHSLNIPLIAIVYLLPIIVGLYPVTYHGYSFMFVTPVAVSI